MSKKLNRYIVTRFKSCFTALLYEHVGNTVNGSLSVIGVERTFNASSSSLRGIEKAMERQ